MTRIPAAWLPPCKMSRVIVHWTADDYATGVIDLAHYHIIVRYDSTLVRGRHDISDNVSTADGDYAAHTRGCNSGSIGIAADCMLGAVERPFNPGPYPLLKTQWLMLAAVAADLCRFYRIPVTPKTVLQHGEVQKNLGIAQRGKWDICKLPWVPSMSSDAVCEAFRDEVRKALIS